MIAHLGPKSRPAWPRSDAVMLSALRPRQWVRLVIATIALVGTLAGCGGSGSASSSTAPDKLHATTKYRDANQIASLLDSEGVSCRTPRAISAGSSNARSQVSCDHTPYGQLEVYVWSGPVPQQWISALRLVCGSPGGDEYLAGANWAILPVGLNGNGVTGKLGTKLGIAPSHLCT